MLELHPLPQPVKIVYYTHPLCRVAWQMQSNWQRLLHHYGAQISYQFCIAKEAATSLANLSNQVIASSYSACLAVKAAGMQSPAAADLYLSQLRQAALSEDRDISQINVLVEIAREVSKEHRAFFDLHRFGKDFDARATRQALQADFHKIHCNRIDSFPTLTITREGKGVKMKGLCSYSQLVEAVQKLLN